MQQATKTAPVPTVFVRPDPEDLAKMMSTPDVPSCELRGYLWMTFGNFARALCTQDSPALRHLLQGKATGKDTYRYWIGGARHGFAFYGTLKEALERCHKSDKVYMNNDLVAAFFDELCGPVVTGKKKRH